SAPPGPGASRCRSGSGRSWRWPAASCATARCSSSWTSPRPRSTPRPSTRCSSATPPRRAAPRETTGASPSWCRTASPPSGWPTSSSCSTGRASPRSARTTSSWPGAALTPSCTASRPRPTADSFRRITTMTLNETLEQLEALGNEATRKHNAKWGAGDNQFGVKHGDLRALAKNIQPNQELAMALWETGNVDAQLPAILLIKPKDLPAETVDRLVRSISLPHVGDWLSSYVVKQHADKETLRQKWMADADRWAARAGWSLTAERVVKSPDGLDL